MQKNRISLKRNLIYALFTNAFVAFMGFLFHVLIIRNVSKDLYGQYSYFISLSLIFIALSNMGLTGYYLVNSSKRRKDMSKNYYKSIYLRSLLVIIVSPVFLITFILLENTLNLIFLTVLAFVISESFLRGTMIVFRSQEMIKYWSINQVFYYSAKFLLFFIFIYIVDWSSLLLFLFLTLTNTLLTLLVNSILKRKLLRVSLRKLILVAKKVSVKREIKRIVPFTLFQVFFIMFYKVDVIMISKMVSDSAVALYSSAFLIIQALINVSKSISIAIAPRFALYYEKSERKRLDELINKLIPLIQYTSFLILGIILVYGWKIIILIFSERYSDAAGILSILIFSFFLIFYHDLFAILMNNTGHESYATLFYGIAMAINIIPNFVLIPLWGAKGAAIATVAAFTFLASISYIYTLRKITNKMVFFRRFFIFSIITAITYLICNHYFKQELFLGVAVFVSIYTLLSIILKVFPEEGFKFIRGMIKSISTRANR